MQNGKLLGPEWECGDGDKPGITLDCNWTGDKGEKGISMKFAKGPDTAKDDTSEGSTGAPSTAADATRGPA